MTLRVQAGDELTSFELNRALFGGETGLAVDRRRQDGYLVDVFDADGGRVAEAAAVVDMRLLEAGTYFVRVFNPFNTLPDDDDPKIEMIAPDQGDTRPQTDRDLLRAGDGDDVLVGRGCLDRMFGESGRDAFIGEEIEVFDRDVFTLLIIPTPFGESLQDVPTDDHSSTQPKSVDVVVDVPDVELAVTLAAQLDIPVTTSFQNRPLLHLPLWASDLNTIGRLEASGAGIGNLEGVGHATNIVFANLAGNNISDISPIASATYLPTGGQIGWTRVEYLALDDNAIGDLAPLELLLKLKALSLDYNAVTDVGPLETAFGRTDLTFLSIDGRPNTMTALPGSELYTGFGLFGALVNPDDPTAFDGFGMTVATAGNRIIVGSPYEEVSSASSAGVVRVCSTP